MPFNFDELRAESLKLLIEFLDGELELAQTLLQSARLAADAGHHDHAAQAKAKVQAAAESVRRRVKSVPDGPVKAGIQERLADLELRITELSD